MDALIGVLLTLLHRRLLPDGTLGPVHKDFECALQGNRRGSLRTDLALFDLIFFVAFGLTMEVSTAVLILMCAPQAQASSAVTAEPHPTHSTRAPLDRLPWCTAVLQQAADFFNAFMCKPGEDGKRQLMSKRTLHDWSE